MILWKKRWGVELLQEALKRELENNSISMNLQQNYWYSDTAHNHIEQLNNDINNYLKHQTLIACFSLEADQLSQWRAYGQDGEGIAVGFDYNYLKRLLKGQDKILIDKVVYRKNDQEKLIRKKMFIPAIEYMRDKFQRDVVRCSDDFNTYFIEEFDCFCEVLDTATEQVFTFLKNPAFIEEKEVRIFYNTGIYDEIDTGELREALSEKIEIGTKKELILCPMQYQAKGNKLVAYADLNFDNCKNRIIEEIVVGPKSMVSEKDIRQFLLTSGYSDDDISIRTSRASYQ